MKERYTHLFYYIRNDGHPKSLITLEKEAPYFPDYRGQNAPSDSDYKGKERRPYSLIVVKKKAPLLYDYVQCKNAP